LTIGDVSPIVHLMNDAAVNNVLVYIALLASLPQVYKLEHKGHWTSEQVRTHVFTVWGGRVCVEANTYHGACSRSYHTPEQARELWARYKGQGFTEVKP
jgi:hypothetical protein